VLLVGGSRRHLGPFPGSAGVARAADEDGRRGALFTTEKPASLSLFALGPSQNASGNVVTVPHLLSFLTDWHWYSKIYGVNYWQREYAKDYGPGNYEPIVAVNYWSFRLMTGIGFLLAGWSLLGSGSRAGASSSARAASCAGRFRFWRFPSSPIRSLAAARDGAPALVVEGLLKTSDAFSHSVSVQAVAFTLVGFILVYTLLAAIEAWLVVYVVKRGPTPPAGEGEQPKQIELGTRWSSPTPSSVCGASGSS